ncbi:MAG: hypothetical protein WC307_00355 [Candidatus Nanoarchaeia archaeon]
MAAIIAMSAYTFIQSYNIGQVQSFDRSPKTEVNDFLTFIESVELGSIIKDYDYLRLNSLFNYFFYETIYYYFEPVYYEKIIVASTLDNDSPISFTYHFPNGIDKNSIRLISGDYELSTNALFNWYYVPIVFNESIIDDYISINTTLQQSAINNNSLKFFVRDRETIMSVTNWSASDSSANATIIVYVPEANNSENCYLYFAKNDSYVNISYPSLTATREVNVTLFNTQEARTAEVMFSPGNLTTSTFYIKYSLFTSEGNHYTSLTGINNTGLTIILQDNKIKRGSAPTTTSIKGSESIKRIVPLSNGFVELKVYGGYI